MLKVWWLLQKQIGVKQVVLLTFDYVLNIANNNYLLTFLLAEAIILALLRLSELSAACRSICNSKSSSLIPPIVTSR